MLLLPPHALLFSHPLLAVGSGAWGRIVTSIFNLLLLVIITRTAFEFEGSYDCKVQCPLSIPERAG